MILKEEQKVFDRGGESLVDLQKQFASTMEKYFKTIYDAVIEKIEDDPQFKVEIKKYAEEEIAGFNDFVDGVSSYLKKGAIAGMKYLDDNFIKTAQVTTAIGIDNDLAVVWAKDHSAELITQITETTQKRINKLVADAVAGDIWKTDLIYTLKTDYAFSAYRASFVASNEIGTAYMRWKQMQFNKYQKEYWLVGYMKRVSHRDAVTTELCLENDNAWWILYNQAFPSWDTEPPRFPWCRCNIDYKLFKPE